MHNGLTIQRLLRSIAKQPNANSSLDCRTGGDSLHLAIPVCINYLTKLGSAFGSTPFFCPNLFSFCSFFLAIYPGRVQSSDHIIYAGFRVVTIYYICRVQSGDHIILFVFRVVTRTKREQNKAEEQNVNELWRVEQNVNVQMSSKKYILRQYDAAFLCIFPRICKAYSLCIPCMAGFRSLHLNPSHYSATIVPQSATIPSRSYLRL